MDDQAIKADADAEAALTPRQNADGSVTVPLRFPIQSEGVTITQVTIRRPKGATLRRLDGFTGDIGATLGLIQVTALLAPSCVDQLDGDDIDAIGTVLKGFTKRRPATISA